MFVFRFLCHSFFFLSISRNCLCIPYKFSLRLRVVCLVEVVHAWSNWFSCSTMVLRSKISASPWPGLCFRVCACVFAAHVLVTWSQPTIEIRSEIPAPQPVSDPFLTCFSRDSNNDDYKLIGPAPPAGPLLLIRMDAVRAHLFFSIVMLATRQMIGDII